MLDLFLAVILLIGLIRGFLKGFIFEVAILGVLFLGFWAGFKFAAYANPYVLKVISPDPKTLYYISSFVMFLLISFGVILLAKLFTGLVNIAALGIFNKIAGAVFGFFKHALILSIVIFYFNKLDTKYKWLDPDTKAESHLYYPLAKIAPVVLPVMEGLKNKWYEIK
ncbi:MAG TPA: CvpA family protein [Bacteroidia bacterium]|nr:CvpA family protein [Bacteroidia bacterium]